MNEFKRFLGMMGIVGLVMIIALPLASNSATIPSDLSSLSIGTSLSQIIAYWRNVLEVIIGGM